MSEVPLLALLGKQGLLKSKDTQRPQGGPVLLGIALL